MPTIRMPMLDAKSLASALLPHTERDGWRDSVLSHVAIVSGDADAGQYAYACDRYTLGRYDLTNVTTEWPTEPMMIPTDLLSVLLTIGPKTLLFPPVEYEVVIQTGLASPDSKRWEAVLRLRHVSRESKDAEPEYALHYMRVFHAIDQTKPYPPTTRLFDAWLPGEKVRNPIVLNPEYITRVTGFAKRYKYQVRFTLPADKGDTRGATGMLAEVGPRLKAIIMPVLVPGLMYGTDFGVDLVARNVERDAAAKAEADSATDTDTTMPDSATVDIAEDGA